MKHSFSPSFIFIYLQLNNFPHLLRHTLLLIKAKDLAALHFWALILICYSCVGDQAMGEIKGEKKMEGKRRKRQTHTTMLYIKPPTNHSFVLQRECSCIHFLSDGLVIVWLHVCMDKVKGHSATKGHSGKPVLWYYGGWHQGETDQALNAHDSQHHKQWLEMGEEPEVRLAQQGEKRKRSDNVKVWWPETSVW